MGKIYVVGIGPGDRAGLTGRAEQVLRECDVIVGYKAYLSLIRESFPDKEFIESGMRQELERCRTCIRIAREGRKAALVSSGDPGIYGMASPLLSMAAEEGFGEIEIVPGITAASSGAALLGAPIGHDFCVISLSDLLTPWEKIARRLLLAAEADFCIVLYNPGSRKRAGHLKQACELLMTVLPPDRCCGIVRSIGREGEQKKLCTLKELAEEHADMFTTVFIGNSGTEFMAGNLVTPRGYRET